jgi:hypothetical protein
MRKPFVPGAVENVWQPQYSHTVIGPEVEGEYWFFQRPVGQGGATFEDTDMYLAGMMPKGNRFIVTSVGAYVVPDWPKQRGRVRRDIRDTLKVLSRGMVELRVGNRTYLRMAPVAALPPDFPMYWAADDGRLKRLLSAPPVEATGEAVKRVKHGHEIVPIMIDGYQAFSVAITFHKRFTLDAPARLGVILYGHVLRDEI